jgi:Tol biopolymer transport system component
MNKWNCPFLQARGSLFSVGAMAATFILVVIFPLSASSAPLQLLSVRDSSVSQPAGGNGNSVTPQISPDGRFVLFTSSASDLVSGDNGLFSLDVFLRDRASNTTTLVSVNLSDAGGGNGNSMSGMVSTNGRFVVFQSDASDLVPGDTNGVSDIFLRDLVAGTTALVSVATNGGFANDASTDPVMTPDGRYVVFVSAATNPVANDTNGILDVFVRDTVGNATAFVSVGASGGNSMAAPVITPDGRYVAFVSNAKGLAPGVSTLAQSEIFLRDLVAGTTTWISSNASLIVSNYLHFNYAPSYHPVLSDDGRFVAFKTGWTNGAIATGIPSQPSTAWVFQYDATTGVTTLVSTNGFPRWAYSDDVYGPEMTPDGRFIAYVATNRAQSCTSVNLWDAQTGTNILVSAALDGSFPTNTISYAPSVSADGRFVVFLSTASNLVTNTVASGVHIYLRDMQAGTTRLVDVDTNNVGSTDELQAVPNLTPDGRFVAFASRDGSLIAQDNNNALDVFTRDTAVASTELISQRGLGSQTGNGLSSLGQFSLSADGRWVTFASYASDLVTNDFNNDRDVFVSDLQTGNITLVSVGLDGNAGLGGGSGSPVISADGHFVAFVSAATNLVASGNNGPANIFLRNLDIGTTTLVNVNSNGVVSGTGDASAPVISATGQYVAFLAKSIPTTTFPGTFWKNTVGGRMVTINSGASGNGPSISADGQRVAWSSSSQSLNVWNAPTLANIYTYPGAVSSAVLSPTGSRVAYQSSTAKQFIVHDLAGNTNLFSCTDATPMKNTSAWSSDGRFITFVSGAPLAPNDNNGTNDVYLCDLQTGTLTLISVNSSWTASGNGSSDWPVISGDVRFIAFRTLASDIVAGATNAPNLILFDRARSSNSLLATGSAGSWSFFVSQPAISSNDTAVVFQSWDSGLAAGDLNRVQDVFAVSENPVILDSDGDGIPDWWMTQYFGHATGQAGDFSRAQDDADGDGMSNLQEYLTGTDPINPDSFFALQISATVASANVLLTWPTVPGKSYEVQYSDSLAAPNWLNYFGSAVVLGGQGSVTVPATQTTRFYRAVCVP